MARLKLAPPKGIIATAPPLGHFTHHRYEVDAPLNRSIEHWWSVVWRMPKGAEQPRSTLGHPCVHVVFQDGSATVTGVVPGRFTWKLHGTGRVFAAKFRPGAFRPLMNASVSTLTGKVVPLRDVIGAKRATAYETALSTCRTDAQRVVRATKFFTDLVPAPSADASLLSALVEAATTDRSITNVEALRQRAGLHLRDLQRWFRDAVGISPKWMIQRYRLHDALTALEAGTGSLAQLSHELGYADQAHFARDFKALVGLTPAQYRAAAR